MWRSKRNSPSVPPRTKTTSGYMHRMSSRPSPSRSNTATKLPPHPRRVPSASPPSVRFQMTCPSRPSRRNVSSLCIVLRRRLTHTSSHARSTNRPANHRVRPPTFHAGGSPGKSRKSRCQTSRASSPSARTAAGPSPGARARRRMPGSPMASASSEGPARLPSRRISPVRPPRQTVISTIPARGPPALRVRKIASSPRGADPDRRVRRPDLAIARSEGSGIRAPLVAVRKSSAAPSASMSRRPARWRPAMSSAPAPVVPSKATTCHFSSPAPSKIETTISRRPSPSISGPGSGPGRRIVRLRVIPRSMSFCQRGTRPPSFQPRTSMWFSKSARMMNSLRPSRSTSKAPSDVPLFSNPLSKVTRSSPGRSGRKSATL